MKFQFSLFAVLVLAPANSRSATAVHAIEVGNRAHLRRGPADADDDGDEELPAYHETKHLLSEDKGSSGDDHPKGSSSTASSEGGSSTSLHAEGSVTRGSAVDLGDLSARRSNFRRASEAVNRLSIIQEPPMAAKNKGRQEEGSLVNGPSYNELAFMTQREIMAATSLVSLGLVIGGVLFPQTKSKTVRSHATSNNSPSPLPLLLIPANDGAGLPAPPPFGPS